MTIITKKKWTCLVKTQLKHLFKIKVNVHLATDLHKDLVFDSIKFIIKYPKHAAPPRSIWKWIGTTFTTYQFDISKIHSSCTSAKEDTVADHLQLHLSGSNYATQERKWTKFHEHLNFLKLHNISQFHQNLRECTTL